MGVTRNKNVYVPGVIVDVTHGDQLLYRVTVRGATPGKFTLVDAKTKNLIWSSNDNPASVEPHFVYERCWPRPIDSVQTQTSHTMGLHFLATREIKYEVLLEHELGAPQTVLDIDYEATEDTDFYFEDLMVTTF